jgi:DNA-binding NarL/FixJ family response regulator
MSAIRVAIADDQELFCSGVQMLIESQPDLAYAGAAHDGNQAVELAERERPDVMLMDVRMSGIDGIEATRRILSATRSDGEQNTITKIVVLTTLQRDDAVVRAIRAGAHGFIIKDTTPEFILASIRTVHAGRSVIAPSNTAALFRNRSWDDDRPPAEESISALSAREKEIFLFAARGLSNAEIGQTAYISEATAKSHLRSILNKLGLISRVQLIAFAYDHRLIVPTAPPNNQGAQ